jgi:hypothetical protein
MMRANNVASLYGIDQAQVTNSSAWGINTTTADNAGTSNTFLAGYEPDMWVLGTPAAVYGTFTTLNGSTGTVPPLAIAHEISTPSRTDGGKWQIGFNSDSGCCSTALNVGPNAKQAASIPSQNVSFCRFDSGSTEHCDAFMNANALGSFNVNVVAGQFINLNAAVGVSGSLVFNTSPGQHFQFQAANNDIAGQCSSASGTTCSIGFSNAYANNPVCVATATTTSMGAYAIATSHTGLTISYTNSGAATFNYICMANPT